MKTPFERFLEKHQDDLTSIYGSMNNLVVKDRFGDLINELETYRVEQENYGKYKKLAERYNLNQLDENEKNSLFTTSILDRSNPELANDPAYQRYTEMNKGIINDNDLNEFMKLNSPDYNNYLSTTEIPYDPKAYDEAVFKKSGFTKEDAELFGKYKNKDIEASNKELLNFLLSNEPNLNSIGSLGNKLGTQFLKMGSNYALTPGKEKTLKPVISNNKIYYFDQSGNLVKTDDFTDKNKNVMKDHWNKPENWWVEKDENGNYYYATNFNDGSAWTVKKVRELTQQEKSDYEASLLEEENKGSKKYRSGRKYSSGPKSKTDKTSGLDDGTSLDNPDNEEGDVSSDLWADTQNAVNKNQSKYDEWNKNKDDWAEQKRIIAEDLAYYKQLWEGNTLTADQMMEEINDYIKDLEENDFAPEIIKEAKDTISSYMGGKR